LAPPALPGFVATMAPSETQASHRPSGDVGFPTGSGLPSIAQITFSRMPCSLPRWIGLVLDGCCNGALPRRVLPRPHWPSRNERPVGIHIFPFEACSSFTRVTACGVARPPKSGLCHEAPARPVTRPNRSSATKAYRQLLAWVLPPLVICAVEAHIRLVNSLSAPENREQEGDESHETPTEMPVPPRAS
jgi:hypothetical protein